jgi:hypothetical protein
MPAAHHVSREAALLTVAAPFLGGQLIPGVGAAHCAAVRVDEMLEAAAGATLTLQGAGVGAGLASTAHFSPS